VNRSPAALAALAALLLAGCFEDTDEDPPADVGAEADLGVAADQAIGDAEPEPEADASVDEPDAEPEPIEVGERWRLTVTVVESGGLRLPFQIEATLDEARTVFERFAIRSIDAADTPSPVLAEVRDAPIAGDGSFVIDFGTVVLPAAYNPAGIDVMVTLRLDGQVVDEGSWCGAVRGAVPLLMIELEESTFGAAPWPAPAPGACADDGPAEVYIGGERPAEVLVPSGYDPEVAYPLVMVLHGYGAAGRLQAGFLRLVERVEADGLIMVMPDGTVDATGKRHWQGRSCCGEGGAPVDDTAYLVGLVEEASARWNVDATRVFAIGHSNGGFMAFDLACLAADTFTGIVSLAGSAGREGLPCPGAGRVAVLDVHGTEDDTVLFAGAPWHLGAVASAELWSERNGCGPAVDEAPLDLLPALPGAETTVRTWSGCEAPVGLWTLVGEGHVPQFDAAFGIETLEWLSNAVAP
jgi:polyhydroxybutyrate depolymerase